MLNDLSEIKKITSMQVSGALEVQSVGDRAEMQRVIG